MIAGLIISVVMLILSYLNAEIFPKITNKRRKI